MPAIHSSLRFENGCLTLNLNTHVLKKVHIRLDLTDSHTIPVIESIENDREYMLVTKDFDIKSEYFIVNYPTNKYIKHINDIENKYIAHQIASYSENDTTYFINLIKLLVPFISSTHKCKFIVTFMDTVKCKLVFDKVNNLYYVDIPHTFYKIVIDAEARFEVEKEKQVKVDAYLESIARKNEIAEQKMIEYNKQLNMTKLEDDSMTDSLHKSKEPVENKTKKKKKKTKKKKKKKDDVSLSDTPTDKTQSTDDDMDYLNTVIQSQVSQINPLNINKVNEIFISWRNVVKQRKYITRLHIGRPVFINDVNIWHNIIICFRYLKFNINTLDPIYCMVDKYLPINNSIFTKKKIEFSKTSKTFQNMILKVNEGYQYFEENIANLLTIITPVLNIFIDNKSSLVYEYPDDNVDALQIIIIYIKLLQLPEYTQLLRNINIYEREYRFSNTLYLLYSYNKYINYKVLNKNIVTLTLILDQLVYHIVYINTMISTKLVDIMDSNQNYLEIFSKLHYYKDPQKQYSFAESNIDEDNLTYIRKSTVPFEVSYKLWIRCYPIFKKLDFLKIQRELHYQSLFETHILNIVKDITIEKYLTRVLYNTTGDEYKLCNPFLYLYEKKLLNNEVDDYHRDLYMMITTMYVNSQLSQQAYILKQKIDKTIVGSSNLYNKCCIQNGYPVSLDVDITTCDKTEFYKKINEICTMIQFGYIEYYNVLFNNIISHCTRVEQLINIFKCLTVNLFSVRNDLLEYITGNNLLDYIDIIQKYKNREYSLLDVMDILKYYQIEHEKQGGLLLIDYPELSDLNVQFPNKIMSYLIGCSVYNHYKTNIIYLYSYIYRKLNKNNKILTNILQYMEIFSTDIENICNVVSDIPAIPCKQLFIESIYIKEYIDRCK